MLEVFRRSRGRGGEEDGVVYVQGCDRHEKIAVACFPICKRVTCELLDFIEFLQGKRTPLCRFEQVGEGADSHHDIVFCWDIGLCHACN